MGPANEKVHFDMAARTPKVQTPVQSEPIGLPLLWVDLEGTEIKFANMILVQQGEGDECILAFGQVAPPVIVEADPRKVRESLERIDYLPVRTVVRMGTTMDRLEQFAGLMQTVVKRWRDNQATPRGARKPRQ